MKNISFNLTTDQIRSHTKTVTRRQGWADLKRGDLLQACAKCQGLKPGEKVERLCVIRVKDVRVEPLNALTGGSYTGKAAKREVIAEGFPELSPREFVQMFCREMGIHPDERVRRIEFEYV